jgi:hypothetical protein
VIAEEIKPVHGDGLRHVSADFRRLPLRQVVLAVEIQRLQ